MQLTLTNQIETFELNGLNDSDFVVTVERDGGGANIWGPFSTCEEAEAAKATVSHPWEDEIHVRTVAEAKADFCD